ncbi:MAG: hypothetical protein JXR29_05775 [Methylothermaceae bacterium]|nr:hypothetical protein [Methylothermaceae bacterium]
MNDQLTTLPGSRKAQERKRALLFSRPESFSGEEFDRLCDELELSLADVGDLIAKRVERLASDRLERDLLIAFIEGRDSDAERLTAILERRNALGLRVISGS